MRSVSYRLADLIKARIPLGFVGENEHTVVQFDAKQAFEQYPTATPSLTVKNPSGEKYPAVVVRDGDMVIWTISDSDLIVPGRGEFQLQFKEGETVMRSYVGETRIERSIMPTGDVPTPVQNWIDAAEDVLGEVEEAIPAGGTTGQVLAKKSDADRDTEWVDQTGGGGGTTNYNALSNKPQIGGVTLSGNKTLHDLGAAAEADIPDVSGFYTKPQTGIPASDLASGVIPDVSGFYTKPSGGIPSSDMASAVKTSLGKADTAYQKPGSGIPASDIASGVIPDVSGFYTKPVTGIPASDLASGVIPTVHNVPAGGSANQVLAKNSGTDYDLKWVDQSGGGGGAEIDDTAGEGDTDVVWSADKTWTETEALKEAIENILVYQEGSGGDSVTLTNLENTTSFKAGLSGGGMNSGSVTDGIYVTTPTGTESSPYVMHNGAWGNKKWIAGFKYKVTKLEQTLGDPTSIRIHLGASQYYDETPVWGEWVDFSKNVTLDMTRIRFAVRGFASNPPSGSFKVEIKDMYLYDATDVSAEMCAYIMEQQSENYQDGTVTYGGGEEGYFPDTTLAIEGKAADSKAVGNAIASVRVNVKDFGVKGDGQTDDTDAINTLFANSGVFYFPAGTYKISGTITLPSESEMYGDGDQTIIDMYSCDNLEEETFRGNDKIYPYILVGDNSKLHDFKLIGNSTTQEKRHAGVLVMDAEGSFISNLTVYNINYYPSQTDPNVNAYGICVLRSFRVYVDHCYVEQCGYECIGVADLSHSIVVSNCVTLNGWRTCIQVHRGAYDVDIIGNLMYQTSQAWDACFTLHGVQASPVKNLRIENNVFKATVSPRLREEDYAAVVQLMSYCDGLWFVNNRIEAGDRGLFSSDSNAHFTMIGNLCQCNETTDYRVKVNTANSIIVGNVVENVASGQVVISATSVKAGNIGIS